MNEPVNYAKMESKLGVLDCLTNITKLEPSESGRMEWIEKKEEQ